jgi:hypothetical protein
MSPPEGFSFNLEGVIRNLVKINPNAINLTKALASLEKLDTEREVDSEIGEIVNQIGEYLKIDFNPENSECFSYLRELIGKVIIDITNIHLEKTFPEFYSRNPHLNPIDYSRRALAFLQTRRGCNGGGRPGQKLIETPFGWRRVSGEEKEGPSRYCKTCGEDVDTYIVKGVIYCSICHEPLGNVEEEEKLSSKGR